MRGILGIAGGTAALALLVSLAVVFANNASAARVADNANHLHWTNAAEASTALSRAATGQMVLFALSYESGVADRQSLDHTIDEAVEAARSLTDVADDEPSDIAVAIPKLAVAIEGFLDSTDDIIGLVQTGNYAQADAEREEGLEQAYLKLGRALAEARDIVTARISQSESSANLTSDVIRVLVTLLIPAAALVGYWLIARRQVRDNRIELDARLATEHRMIAGVSHELRTPLTAIYGFSETLLDLNMTDPDEIRSVLLVINSEASDLTRMVDDLLVIAQVDARQLTVAPSLFDPAREIASVASPFIRAGNDITCDSWSGAALTDLGRFRQIVRNLISNAVRHGGQHIVVYGELADDEFRCTVADDGFGVGPEVEARLFEPFVNSGGRALVSGSVGLGLSVSRAVAEALGGTLTYRRSGELTMFRLSLPTEGWPIDPADRMPSDVEHGSRSDGRSGESDDAVVIGEDATPAASPGVVAPPSS